MTDKHATDVLIERFMEKRGLNKAGLARRLGVGDASISHYFAAMRKGASKMTSLALLGWGLELDKYELAELLLAVHRAGSGALELERRSREGW